MLLKALAIILPCYLLASGGDGIPGVSKLIDHH
jgi:hypothetical protein